MGLTMANYWQKMVQYIENYERTHGLILAIILVSISTALVYIVMRWILNKLRDKQSINDNIYLNTIAYAFYSPILAAVNLLGVFFLGLVFNHYIFTSVTTYSLTMVLRVLMCGITLWVTFRLISRFEYNINYFSTNITNLDPMTRIAIGRFARIIAVAIFTLILLHNLDIDIRGLLALGSAGTIVIGIAARDLLANFFGGLMLFTERPFGVGDNIIVKEKNIEGCVENIGWRVTSIRTLEKSPLYIPNAMFLNIGIENLSRRTNRLINEIISIKYKDVDKIDAIVKDIDLMLKDNDKLDMAMSNYSVLSSFNQRGCLDIEIYCFTKTAATAEFLKIKQIILLEIASILDKYNAEIAIINQ